MRKLLVLLLIASFFKVEVVAGPAWFLWGNPRNIRFDEHRNVYINDNPKCESYPRADPKTFKELTKPEEVPVKKTVKISLNVHKAIKPEDHEMRCALMAIAGLQNKKNRFVLIGVEQTPRFDDQYRIWPNLGLLSVGTVAHQEGWEVTIWDELVQGHSNPESIIQEGDVVGLSLLTVGMKRGVELARKAKELGAKYVIAGNDSAIFRSNQLLKLPDKPIDAVFTSNSISTIRAFFQHGNLVNANIPGMVTKAEGFQRSNEASCLLAELVNRRQLKRRGVFDSDDVFITPELNLYSQEHWQGVWSNYRKIFGHKHPDPATARNGIVLFAQGCTRTKGKGTCSYCSIAGVADIRIPSEQYLEDTISAYSKFGINTFFNATDSAYEMRPLLKKLQNIGASFDSLIIYGRAHGLATMPDLLDEWSGLVKDRLLINVGMDSGDPHQLYRGVVKTSSKNEPTTNENREAVRHIAKSDAHLHYSLVFGSSGETIESCERSIEFLEWSIATLGQQLDLVETDIFWLNFGSSASQVFHNYDYAKQLASNVGKSISRAEWQTNFAQYSEELVVPWSAEEAWYRYFTHIDLGVAQSFNDRASSIMSRHRGSVSGRAFQPS